MFNSVVGSMFFVAIASVACLPITICLCFLQACAQCGVFCCHPARAIALALKLMEQSKPVRDRENCGLSFQVQSVHEQFATLEGVRKVQNVHDQIAMLAAIQSSSCYMSDAPTGWTQHAGAGRRPLDMGGPLCTTPEDRFTSY